MDDDTATPVSGSGFLCGTRATVRIGADMPVSAPMNVGAGGYVADRAAVVKVRMLPTEVQAAALAATLRTCNEAA